MSEPPPFRIAHIEELERIPLEHGYWRPVRRDLGVSTFGINAYSADAAGAALIEPHDETSPGAGGHEEVYVVVTGTAAFTVDGKAIEATAGTMVLVQPGVKREAVAVEAPATVLVLGGRPGSALPPSPFEYWYAAIPAEEAREYERAYEIAAEALEHYPNHGTLHFALACFAAQAGRREEALEHLRTAFANDPRTREWARDDADLDPIRADPAYPE